MPSDDYQTFHVGINLFVLKDGKLLLGKRKNVFGDKTWGLPGGHLETDETLIEAGKRELFEETGLVTKNLTFSNLVNDRGHGQHRLQIGFVADDINGEVKLMEPDKCAEWQWFNLTELPNNIFPPHIKQIENFLNNNKFVDE